MKYLLEHKGEILQNSSNSQSPKQHSRINTNKQNYT